MQIRSGSRARFVSWIVALAFLANLFAAPVAAAGTGSSYLGEICSAQGLAPPAADAPHDPQGAEGSHGGHCLLCAGLHLDLHAPPGVLACLVVGGPSGPVRAARHAPVAARHFLLGAPPRAPPPFDA